MLINGRRLVRLDNGTNPASRWATIVTVTHTPVDDTPTRKRVQVDLVKLAITFSGLQNENYGDVSLASGDNPQARITAAMAPLFSSANRMMVI